MAEFTPDLSALIAGRQHAKTVLATGLSVNDLPSEFENSGFDPRLVPLTDRYLRLEKARERELRVSRRVVKTPAATRRAGILDGIALLGYAAAFLTTVAFVPQVVRVWRTRSTEDISLVTFSALVTGIIGWIVYGSLRGELPIILSNAVTLLLAGIILVFKFRAKLSGAEQRAESQ